MIAAFLITLILGMVLGSSLSYLNTLKDFQFFNTWLLFFVCTLLIFIPAGAFFLVNDPVELFMALSPRTIKSILIPSLFGGIGLFLLANSIRKNTSIDAVLLFILSLTVGFALIGFVHSSASIITTAVLVLGGLLWIVLSKEVSLSTLLLPILAGFSASGFALAVEVEPQTILSIGESFGNAPWQVSLFKVALMTIGASIFIIPIFVAQMGQKNAWIYYDTPLFGKNLLLIVLVSALVSIAVLGLSYAIAINGNTENDHLLYMYLTGIIIGNIALLMFLKDRFALTTKKALLLAAILLGLNLNLIVSIVN